MELPKKAEFHSKERKQTIPNLSMQFQYISYECKVFGGSYDVVLDGTVHGVAT